MIVLLGGTSETASLALGLARAGHEVLVSTASDLDLDVGVHPHIRRRCGRLDLGGMVDLLERLPARGLVDATHPYAIEARRTAREAARRCGIPYWTWVRPEGLEEGDDVIRVADHEEAARVACGVGGRVLLTTGSRHLEPYARWGRDRGVEVFARVLDCEESWAACRLAGLPPGRVLAGRGPFSVQENVDVMTRFGIGVVVTKDGGQAGGVRAKVEAARRVGARVVVVQRPPRDADTLASLEALLEAVTRGTTDGTRACGHLD